MRPELQEMIDGLRARQQLSSSFPSSLLTTKIQRLYQWRALIDKHGFAFCQNAALQPLDEVIELVNGIQEVWIDTVCVQKVIELLQRVMVDAPEVEGDLPVNELALRQFQLLDESATEPAGSRTYVLDPDTGKIVEDDW